MVEIIRKNLKPAGEVEDVDSEQSDLVPVMISTIVSYQGSCTGNWE